MRPERIAAILLAAGESTRFGEDDKLMADYRGKPMFAHAMQSLASLPFAHLIAVVRPLAMAPDIHRKLERRGYALLVNDAPGRGLSGSMVMGVDHAVSLRCQGVLICLADMPNISPTHLIKVCEAAIDIRSIVASTDGLVPCPPAFFGRSHFPDLLEMKGDQGARALLSRGVQIEASLAVLRDVDTPDDLAKI
jgi:molybdenum cofactor cytidylyltransferase